MLVGATAILLALASVFLWFSFSFGFAAGEVMANPNARPDANVDLKRAADFAFSLFVLAQLTSAFITVKSGVLMVRLHRAARAGIAIAAGVLISCAIFYGFLSIGGIPRPVTGLADALGTWIQKKVQR